MGKRTGQGAVFAAKKYIDPLTDFGFKYLFGREPHKDLLIAFLNVLLKKEKRIVDLTYMKNEYPGPRKGSRVVVYDLTCTGPDGEQFIIEVQRVGQRFFKDRGVYYASRLIHDQAPKGNEWDYHLKEVYFIGLMNFRFKDSAPEKYIHRVRLTETSGQSFYDKLSLIFIEIPKFTKRQEDLNTDLDRWLYVLKNMSKLKKFPVILKKRIFEKLFNIASVCNLSKREYMRYEKNMMARWDEYVYRKTLREEGIEEGMKTGIKKGIKKGMKTGIETGIKTGIKKGAREKTCEFIRALLAKGSYTIREIADLTGVSEAFVRKVKKAV